MISALINWNQSKLMVVVEEGPNRYIRQQNVQVRDLISVERSSKSQKKQEEMMKNDKRD